MNKERFLELTQLGREGRNLEFKRATAWNNGDFRFRIVKSCLAFSNVRDGGSIVIGVNQNADGTFDFVGMSAADAATYTEDQVASSVAEFADPYVKLVLDRADVDGKVFIIILVEEFDEIPVLCKRDGQANLRRGAVYTRTRRMAESAEVPTQTEMREIFEMAVQKGIKRFYTTLAHAGVGPSVQQFPSDDDKFAQELRDLQ